MGAVKQQNLVKFIVAGREIPVSLSSFRELYTTENLSQKLPTLKFQYSDAFNHLIDNPLADGTEITVVLHSNAENDPEQPREETYRAMGAEYVPLGNRFMVRCAGIFDRMQYLAGIQKMPIKGTSDDAIKQVLKPAGFTKFNFDSAKDSMWWRPSNQMQKIENFVGTIAKHGFINPQSVMSSGVSTDGTFHYKNVAESVKKSGDRTVTEVDRFKEANGDIPLIAWKVLSLGGATNTMSGYGATVKQEKLTGNAEDFSDVIVPLLGGALNMVSALKGTIGDVVRQYVPTDLGNCVVGSTLIPTENGLLKIEDIVDLGSYKNRTSKTINLKVGSRFKSELATKWWYNGKQKTIRTTTELGNEIESTYNHPYLVFDVESGSFVWKKARNCSIGDVVCLNPKQISRNKKLKLNLKYTRPTYKIHQLKARTDVSKPMFMNPDLAFCLGLLVSEGYINEKYATIHNCDEKLIEVYAENIKKIFGIEPSISLVNKKGQNRVINKVHTKSTKDCFIIAVGSKEVINYFRQMGVYTQPQGLKNGKKASWYKTVPWSILQADKESQLAFLAAYLEGDGSIDNKTGRISWYSRSKVLLQQMQILLNTFGYFPHYGKNKTCDGITLNSDESQALWVRLKQFMVTKSLEEKETSCSLNGVDASFWISLLKRRRVYINGLKTGRYGSFYTTDNKSIIQINWKKEGLNKFNNNLGNNLKVFKYIDYKNKDSDLHKFIKVLRKISFTSANNLENILKLGYKFTKIKSIEDCGVKNVYDLSMKPGVEPAFIANGLIIHNTHEKYYQAKEQNSRGLLQLQSTKIEFTTNQATGLKIQDIVQFKPHNPVNSEPLELFHGSYVVTSKTRYLSGARYYREKFVIVNGAFGDQKSQVGYANK